MSRRRLLVLCTLLWFPIAVGGWWLLRGPWLEDRLGSTGVVLVAGVALAYTLFVLTGWLTVGGAALRRRRTADREDQKQIASLEQLQSLSPAEFEAWVKELFVQQGYFVKNTPDARDHGIDLWAVSPQGQETIIQCKRYRGTVGEPTVRDLYGVMEHENAKLGVIVTTGRFTEEAERWAQDKPIELIDGDSLVRMAVVD